jgi:hypothetical protein
MADRELDLNTIRAIKQSPGLVLEEHGHCEVPAGCGGVVLRWRRRVQIPIQIWLHTVASKTVYLDGVEYAGETMIVAVGITADGTKRTLGLRQGATENAAVCVALLEDLQARGLDTSRPVLLVLDGAKALHAAAKRVWGQNGVIQRCQVHKKRNVKAHVPEKHHAELERRLSEAYHETGYEAAKASLEATAR